MTEYVMLCPTCGGLPVDDGPICETCGRGVHHATIRELALAMHELQYKGAPRFRFQLDNWQLACKLGHDGCADNTELRRARNALGDEQCAAVYEAERARLRSTP